MVATPRAPRAAADVARDIRAEMTSTSSSVDALRAHLASALASARDASARVSSDASSDEAVRDASSVRDPRALVARFRAVNDARETLARVARAEAALRDASTGARSVHPSSATRADLPRLREASASLLGASDALRDARDAQLCSDPPRAPAHDRFTASLAARIRAECDRLRAVATRLAVDAAGRTGWPPPINPSAVDAFEWRVDPSSDESAADLCDACAVLGALQAAAENTAKLDGDGIEPATLFESWIASALASPVRDAVERHFVVDASSPANDPSRPERLFACVTRVAARCAPLVDAALRHGIEPATFESRAGGSDAGIRSKASVQRLATGFAVALARIACDVVEGHFIPATETAETEEGYVGARAYSRENCRASDARWLHLADECERFDDEVRALVTRLSSNPKVGRSIPTRAGANFHDADSLPAGCSALATLASSGRDRAVRWMRAELTDCLREIDVAAADTNAGATNDSWSPAGIGAIGVGYEEGDPDPSLALAEVSNPRPSGSGSDGVTAPPVAEKAAECFNRAVDRALSLPKETFVPDTSTSDPAIWDPTHPMYEPPVNARLAYLANVASEFIGVFCDQTLTRRVKAADAYHAMISTVSPTVAANGALRVGDCVCVARRLAGATRDRGEDAAALAAAGGNDNIFGDVVAKLDAFADEWTRKIAETFADAFERSAVSYLSNAHLAGRFGARDDATSDGNGNGDEKSAPGDGDDGNEKSAPGDGDDGDDGDENRNRNQNQNDPRDPRGLGAEVMASSALVRPLRVLRDGLAVVRAALVAADAVDDGGGSCVQSATRVVAQIVCDAILRRVVLGNKAGFTRTGATYFRRDVDAIRACFAPHLRRADNYLGVLNECGVLLNLDASDARAAVAAVDAELRAGAASRGVGETQGNSALASGSVNAAVERLREAHGVHRLTASQVARVLSKRRDAGRGGGL